MSEIEKKEDAVSSDEGFKELSIKDDDDNTMDTKDEDVSEGLVEAGEYGLKTGRITKREFEELKIANERIINLRRYLLALATNLENSGFGKNSFSSAVAASAVITHFCREYKGSMDIRLVTGYFSSDLTHHKYIYPHMWVETSHRREAELWNKIYFDQPHKQWGEELINRVTDICGGTEDVRDAVILGQGVAFSEDSRPLKLYKTKPSDLDFPPSRHKELMRAEKNNKTIKENPEQWILSMNEIYPSGPPKFLSVIENTLKQDPRRLRLLREKDHINKFYERLGETHLRKEEEKKKKELVSIGISEECAERLSKGRGTKEDLDQEKIIRTKSLGGSV